MAFERIKKEIGHAAEQVFSEVVIWRRHIHAHPELSFEEHKTADYIESELKKMGFEHIRRMASTGVVAELSPEKTNKLIALRADIDALPISEKNEKSYKSKVPNVMHACGHDVHSASLLGTAKVLFHIKEQLKGNVRFIFQPGEEKLPGGASILINEGVLTNPVPDLIIGQHVHPPLEVGKVGFCEGNYMASADEIYLEIIGKGGHAAIPQKNIDPIAISAQILVSLQQIVARRANPATPTVLSFGKINSEGGATNVIPNSVKIEGTFRTFDENWRLQAHKLIEKQVTSMAQAMGAIAKIEIKKGYPVLYNDPKLTQTMRHYAQDTLDENHVVSLPIRLSSEDFSFYSQKIPACFYRLGTGNVAKGITSGVHTSTFDIDENALLIGVKVMSTITARYLSDDYSHVV